MTTTNLLLTMPRSVATAVLLLLFLYSSVTDARHALSTTLVSPAFHRQLPSCSRRTTSLDDPTCQEASIFSRSRRSSTHQDQRLSAVQNVSITKKAASGVAKQLGRGALLRIASDISGGTPLESIKCRVTISKDLGPVGAVRAIFRESGVLGLWSGTPSRTLEGALLGALFIVGSSCARTQTLQLTGNPALAALAGGLVGGVAQAIVMTPAGMIFTSLSVNRAKVGFENDNALTVAKRIISEKGVGGLFYGGGPMCLRQASNWASRSCFTEIARSTFGMSQMGLLGELGSGVIGGVGSCWNTPIETIRVLMQKDVSEGRPTKSPSGYWQDIVEEQGYQGLFRGVTPRAVQAVWQTFFMVVVPNVVGF